MRLFLVYIALLLAGCATTEVIESPKTVFIPDTAPAKVPMVIWTSRTLTRHFDYLGVIKTRSWGYETALDRLISTGESIKADAIIDVHFERVGFLSTLQAFAIKFR